MLTKQSAVLAVVAVLVGEVRGHGSMVEPPARAVMHNYGFPDNPAGNWELGPARGDYKMLMMKSSSRLQLDGGFLRGQGPPVERGHRGPLRDLRRRVGRPGQGEL